MTYPTVSINNVYMYPGIPELLVKSFTNMKETLFKSNKKFYSKFVYFNITEDKIAKVLQILVDEYPDVQFGSYPKLLHRYCIFQSGIYLLKFVCCSLYKVKVTIESCDEESTLKAYNRLLALVPKNYLVDVEDVQLLLYIQDDILFED